MKILVADDETILADILADEIEDTFDCEVLTAYDGQQAYDFFKSNSDIALIVTDYKMPRMTGAELIDAIHKNSSIDNKPEIILITAFEPGDIAATLKNHSIEVMKKPFDYDHLFVAMKNLLT